jgi:hypothetical protein
LPVSIVQHTKKKKKIEIKNWRENVTRFFCFALIAVTARSVQSQLCL